MRPLAPRVAPRSPRGRFQPGQPAARAALAPALLATLVAAIAACDADRSAARRPSASSATADEPAPDSAASEPRVAPEDPIRRFDAAFRRARPPATPGWRPEVGETVLARFVDASWYTAEVIEIRATKRKARVRWSAGSGDDRDLPLVDLAPLRPGASAPGLALARPEGDGRWEPVEVQTIDGDHAEITDRRGRRRRVPRAVLVPLEAR